MLSNGRVAHSFPRGFLELCDSPPQSFAIVREDWPFLAAPTIEYRLKYKHDHALNIHLSLDPSLADASSHAAPLPLALLPPSVPVELDISPQFLAFPNTLSASVVAVLATE